MNSPEISIKDRSVEDIHLENGYIFVIDTNLKVFAEAIHVLSKISEQVLLQPSADSLVMTAFNSTKSAYGKTTLASNFFSRSEGPPIEQQIPENNAYCRISTRTLLHIFKNVVSKHLAVPSFDSCQFELDPRADYAIVHLKQEPALISRAFVLPMKEQTAICDNIFTERHRLKNKMTTQPKMLLTVFAGLDCRETKLVSTCNKFTAHRYIIREDLNKVRKTEVSVPAEHFEVYHIHLATQIIVSLKELRSILHFADNCGMAVTLHFDRPGRPLIVAVEDTVEFRAEFVLATMDEADPSTALAAPSTEQEQTQNQDQTQNQNYTPQQQQTTPQLRHKQPKPAQPIITQTPTPHILANKQREGRQLRRPTTAAPNDDRNENDLPRYAASFC